MNPTSTSLPPIIGLSMGLGAIIATLYQPFVRHPAEIGGCILLGIILAYRWARSDARLTERMETRS